MTPVFSLWRPWLAALALGGAAAVAAQTPPPPAAPAATAALELSADGQLVIDRRSRLAWARCAEGMQWNGTTCAGQRQREALAPAGAVCDQHELLAIVDQLFVAEDAPQREDWSTGRRIGIRVELHHGIVAG